MAEKRNPCDFCGQEIPAGKKGRYCSRECHDHDTEPEEGDDFECCDDCDLPDACGDFGCAIKAGLREPSNF